MSIFPYATIVNKERVEISVDETPWLPFSTCADYEFVEIILEAGLNTKQSNCLISLVHRIAKGENFSLKNHAEVQKRWGEASSKLTKVRDNNELQYHSSIHKLLSLQRRRSLCHIKIKSMNTPSITAQYGIGLATS